MLTVITVLGIALLAGITLKRILHPFTGYGDREGIAISEFTDPLQNLAALLIAFVIVLAADSYAEANQAVTDEARTISRLYALADYAPEPERRDLKAELICYARAVHVLEWNWMAKGGYASPVPTVWSERIREVFHRLADNQLQVFPLMLEAEDARASARHTRVSESQPDIPGVLFWFMTLTVGATLIGFALSIPKTGNQVHLGGLVTLMLLFLLSLYLIEDFDLPYQGLVSVEPTALEETENDVTREFEATYGESSLPCDDSGNPR